MRTQVAVYALTRGYEWKFSYRYLALVARTVSLRIALLPRVLGNRFTWVIFHEGNISSVQQTVLKILCLTRIRFVDVSVDFIPPVGHVHKSEFPLGYHLMCRFQYSGVWKYLDSYDVALRVDEDCLVLKAPKFPEAASIVVGAMSLESHEPTLQTMQKFIDAQVDDLSLSMEKYPYTNVMACNLDFFRRPEVQKILSSFEAHPDSFSNRWGDLPVLGLVASHHLGLDGLTQVDPSTIYFHLSHASWVVRGELK